MQTDPFRRAVSLHQAGDLPEARRLYLQLIRSNPDHVPALNLLGCLELQLGDYAAAERVISKAIQIAPQSDSSHYNLAVALHGLGRFNEAVASYDRALEFNHGSSDAWINRGIALRELGRFENAIASLDKALAINPDSFDVWYNRGNALHATDCLHDALASYDKAIQLRPEFVEALSNRGLVLRDLGRAEEALASYGRALAIKPLFVEARFNRSLSWLAAGDFCRGWPEYEWRLKKDGQVPPGLTFSQSNWRGDKSVEGKSVLLFAEQGLGDTLQFARYVPLVASMGAKVVLEVQAALKRLLSQIEGIVAIVSTGEKLPPFDFHCPLMSLPLVFKTDLAAIPSSVPYLKAEPRIFELQRARLPDQPSLRVGLAWSGNPKNQNNRRRSISLDRLVRLFSVPGVRFISLQPDVEPQDARILQVLPNFTHIGPTLGDFAEVAALIAHLDIVVTVDTAFAHLAGALGKPVWILLSHAPDWRWMYEREDSPWYPTARLFRQPTIGDWDSVVDRVMQELTFAVEQRKNDHD